MMLSLVPTTTLSSLSSLPARNRNSALPSSQGVLFFSRCSTLSSRTEPSKTHHQWFAPSLPLAHQSQSLRLRICISGSSAPVDYSYVKGSGGSELNEAMGGLSLEELSGYEKERASAAERESLGYRDYKREY